MAQFLFALTLLFVICMLAAYEFHVTTHRMRHLLYIIPVLCALWMFDNWLTNDRRLGGERHAVRDVLKRVENRAHARVAVMGQSTSADWLGHRYLSRLLKISQHRLVMAHINGSHHGTAFALARKLGRWGRRYHRVFLGVQQYQLCELTHSKRVMQQQMLLPRDDFFLMVKLYMSAQQPLKYLGRYLGMTISGAYGDTLSLRYTYGHHMFGEPQRHLAHLWHHPRKAKKQPAGDDCSFSSKAIAYKLNAIDATLRELLTYSEHVYLMLLPERKLDMADSALRTRWLRHRARLKKIVMRHKNTYLVDLVTTAKHTRHSFSDAIHLTSRGKRIQRSIFERRLRELGAIKGGRPK